MGSVTYNKYNLLTPVEYPGYCFGVCVRGGRDLMWDNGDELNCAHD